MCFLSLGQSSLLLTLTFLCLAWSAGLPRAPEAAPGDRQSLPLRAHGQGQARCQRLPANRSQVGPHLTASLGSCRAGTRHGSLRRAAGERLQPLRLALMGLHGLRPVLLPQTKMGQAHSAQLGTGGSANKAEVRRCSNQRGNSDSIKILAPVCVEAEGCATAHKGLNHPRGDS